MNIFAVYIQYTCLQKLLSSENHCYRLRKYFRKVLYDKARWGGVGSDDGIEKQGVLLTCEIGGQWLAVQDGWGLYTHSLVYLIFLSLSYFFRIWLYVKIRLQSNKSSRAQNKINDHQLFMLPVLVWIFRRFIHFKILCTLCFTQYNNLEPVSWRCFKTDLVIKHNLAHISVLNYVLTLWHSNCSSNFMIYYSFLLSILISASLSHLFHVFLLLFFLQFTGDNPQTWGHTSILAKAKEVDQWRL